MDDVLQTVDRKVSDEMNIDLNAEFTREEIVAAIGQMHSTKAPGPDGLPALFYQKFWEIVGNDTVEVILNYLNGSTSLAPLNFTNIVLIPKVKSPRLMSEYRPISLCNVSYKIIAKVLANRFIFCQS